MENENFESTPASFLKLNSVIHLALLAGIVFFGVISLYLIDNPEFRLNDTNDIFFFIVPIAALIGMLMSNILYKKTIATLADKNSLKEKLAGFQSASIMKLALIEVPALLGNIAFFLTENLLYLLISGVLVIYFFMQRPTKERVINDLELNGSMKDQFNEKDKVIE